MRTIGVECAFARCTLWERVNEQLLHAAWMHLEVQRASHRVLPRLRDRRHGKHYKTKERERERNIKRTTGNTLILSSDQGDSSPRGTSLPSLSILSPVLCAAAGVIHSYGWGA